MIRNGSTITMSVEQYDELEGKEAKLKEIAEKREKYICSIATEVETNIKDNLLAIKKNNNSYGRYHYGCAVLPNVSYYDWYSPEKAFDLFIKDEFNCTLDELKKKLEIASKALDTQNRLKLASMWKFREWRVGNVDL